MTKTKQPSWVKEVKKLQHEYPDMYTDDAHDAVLALSEHAFVAYISLQLSYILDYLNELERPNQYPGASSLADILALIDGRLPKGTSQYLDILDPTMNRPE